jgi:hypothetical protein
MDIPSFLKNTKAIINIKNTDNKCFLLSVLRGIYPKNKNAERYADLKNYEKTINMSDIEYPVKFTSFEKFENQNNININVYRYTNYNKNLDKKAFIYPIYISKEDPFKAINLLFVENKIKNQSHYCLIKNFSRLNNNITKHKESALFCMRCLSYFYNTAKSKKNDEEKGKTTVRTAKEKLHDHIQLCSKHDFCKVEMPTKENKMLFFKDHSKQIRIPYFIHCDFECLTVKMYEHKTNNINIMCFHNLGSIWFLIILYSNFLQFYMRDLIHILNY